MAGESVAPEVCSAVSQLDKDTMIVQHLIQMRRHAGLTQQQMAVFPGKTQGAISKLESSADSEITLEELRSYIQATNAQIILSVGKPMNHVASVRWHAFGIKDHLSALAKMAHGDGEKEQAMQGFFGPAFFNLLASLSKCQEERPDRQRAEVRIKNLGGLFQTSQAQAPANETLPA